AYEAAIASTIGAGVGWSGLPMPKSIKSAPRARAAALSSSSHANTYVGSSVSRCVGASPAGSLGVSVAARRAGALVIERRNKGLHIRQLSGLRPGSPAKPLLLEHSASCGVQLDAYLCIIGHKDVGSGRRAVPTNRQGPRRSKTVRDPRA